MLKLKLLTDYSDYYDEFFDNDGETFGRLNIPFLSLAERLVMLRSKGFRVPRHGKANEVKNDFAHDSQVWVEETGTEMSFAEALNQCPTSQVTEILAGEVPDLWFEQVVIGDRSWLFYHQDGKMVLKQSITLRYDLFPFPLYSLRLQKDVETFYATNLSVCPVLRDFCMYDVLDGKRVVGLIKKKFFKVKYGNG